VNELERSLYALGQELAVPDAPDLVPGVLAQIPRQRGPRIPQRRRWMLAVAVVALAALTATLAVPDARAALLRFLHIGGERIELVDELPEITTQPDLELALGEQVTLEEAEQRSDFDLRQLDEDPDRVYLGDRGTVWFLYGTPERIRLLVGQTPRLTVDEPAILKKLSGAGTAVEEVGVNGARGVFLSGEPHFMFLVDELGQVVEDSARLAANVLVWDQEGVAYRIEGELDRDEALEVAAELR
jgi:hypothetical protein